MNKELIKNRFKKHIDDYNNNADVQKIMAEKIATLCSKKHYKKILELGCGTGLLTSEANKNLQFESYTVIDIVDECEKYIKEINPIIEFKLADIENFNYEKYDLIISNAALQWTDDFYGVIKLLATKLNTGGELIFSTFGKENFREIFFISGIGLNYYSEGELKEMFPEALIYPQEIYIKSFDSPKDILKHLQLTGVNAIEAHHWTKKDLKEFENTYNSFCRPKPTLTYNPIYVKIINKTVG